MSLAAFPVLYVDDDRANLASFQYLLADRFQILTASHSDEALRILTTERAAVLLADQRMESGMSGVELCALARREFPGVVRMLVTAYADVGTLQGGINDAQISAYIAKPWREDEMVSKLRCAIDAHRSQKVSREMHVGALRWDQLSVSSFVVGHVLRQLCNPAAAVRDNLDFSQAALPHLGAALGSAPAAAKRRFQEVEQALADASVAAETLVARMAHLRGGEAAASFPPGVSPLGQVAATAAAIMRDDIDQRASLSLQLDEEARVAVDSFRVGRIVTGLLVDAFESIGPGAPEHNRVVLSSFATARHGGVTVETAGPDVQPAPLSTAFDPFPPEGVGRGRGLGLAVLRDLVETSRGEIAIHATGQGTLIRVRFPLAAGAEGQGT
ncbi:MAG: response regulator [Pseudomonadota bacterium]